ncbi:MAG TPA: hypothetical protein VGB69_09025 [Edaphobacter sp.]
MPIAFRQERSALKITLSDEAPFRIVILIEAEGSAINSVQRATST